MTPWQAKLIQWLSFADLLNGPVSSGNPLFLCSSSLVPVATCTFKIDITMATCVCTGYHINIKMKNWIH